MPTADLIQPLHSALTRVASSISLAQTDATKKRRDADLAQAHRDLEDAVRAVGALASELARVEGKTAELHRDIQEARERVNKGDQKADTYRRVLRAVRNVLGGMNTPAGNGLVLLLDESLPPELRI